MEKEHAASLTARAVKKALPERSILTKDARQTLNSATSMFTLYLASIAHETSMANKRSTITLKDVLQTLRDTDFEHFIEPIEACLQEAKAAASRKKNRKITAEGVITTTEVAEQLEEVALETNEEDEAEEDDAMMSVEEPSDVEYENAEDDTEEKGSAETMRDQVEQDGEHTAETEAPSMEHREQEDDADESTEAMEVTQL
ncbi:hypothetical protein BBP00_00006017 [Phytophthora kernoviae]|uniref:Transcription factor CBF/NF-Y/archaeal histone domain-containing protein n=1 Tax=Phytophthora kernoviae TaxID=325452 RepID=A0A3F2RM71_9STRA|nr:hypothetical protein BBP00_00006017 [Phytophthora kernoviae]